MSNIASCAGGSGEFPDGSFEIVTENTFIMVRPIQTSSEKCARTQAKEEAASQKKTERPHKLRRHSGQDRYVRFGEHCVAVIYQDACGETRECWVMHKGCEISVLMLRGFAR